MSWEFKQSLETLCSLSGFRAGVEVWVRRPNVVDKKVLGAMVHLHGKLASGWRTGMEACTSGVVTVRDLSERWSKEKQSSSIEHTQARFVVRALLPKRKQLRQSYELVVTDETVNSVSFFQLITLLKEKEVGEIMDARIILSGAYRFVLTGERRAEEESEETGSTDDHLRTPSIISVYVHESSPLPALEWESTQTQIPSPDWLVAVLLPKLAQWSMEGSSLERACPTPDKGSSLIPLDKYVRLYKHLKGKHGPLLIKNWPEGTDPLKFVYEDIAIATYLMVLWEEERRELQVEKRQSFIDLGCGNGLLVYLLSREGHPGRGLDVRERRTWSLYGKSADLQVCTLTPSTSTLFPEEDWLLGNHSDELTPWIPVIAARSSYKTRFFVLPCCPHDFNRKFHRQESGVSQYRSYLQYIQAIGQKMGFKVQQDTLRIPSSKRICLIGQQRMYPSHQESVIDAQRQCFIDERCGSVQVLDGWVTGFSPREGVEPVRNCTQVAHHVSDCITKAVAMRLLHTECLVCACPREMCGAGGVILASGDGCAPSAGCEAGVRCGDQGISLQKCPHLWNVGGKLALCEVAAMFDGSMLMQLKKECGGLQTLLRNQHQVFQVQAGFVMLRNWIANEKREPALNKNSQSVLLVSNGQRDSKALLCKTKLCWFHEYHPQGCPRNMHSCPYAHGHKELRQRPDFKKMKLQPL